MERMVMILTVTHTQASLLIFIRDERSYRLAEICPVLGCLEGDIVQANINNAC